MTFRITIRDERQLLPSVMFHGQFKAADGLAYDQAMKELLHICALVHSDRRYGMGVDQITPPPEPEAKKKVDV